MFSNYEIRICGNDVTIDFSIWNNIREHARTHKPFYIIYKNKKYKYVKDQTFFNRSTRFDFEKLTDNEEGMIDYINI